MTFILPAFLALGLLCIVVLVLHTQQRKTLAVPSIQLWRRLQRPNNIQRRVWRLPKLTWLLALQLLAVLLAALALAQPLWASRTTPEHWIFVLDGSASMETRDGDGTRFSAAVKDIGDRLAHSDAHLVPRVSLVVAGDTPQLVAARLENAPDVLNARLGRLAPDDVAADWTGASAAVQSLIRPDEQTRVLVLTDGADPGAVKVITAGTKTADTKTADTKTAGDKTVVEELRFGTATPNASLSATVGPDPDAINVPNGVNKDKLVLSGTVSFYGGLRSVPLRVSYLRAGDSTPLDWADETVKLVDSTPNPALAGSTQTFSIPLDLPAAGLVTASIDDGGASFDNSFSAEITDAVPGFKVLYVGHQDEALLKALQAVDNTTLFAADGLPDDVSSYDLVVFDDVEVPALPPTNALWVGSAHLSTEAAPAELKGSDFSYWNKAGPLSFGIDWGGVLYDKAYDLAPRPGSDTVVESGGKPMLASRTTANGREARLAFEPSDSNWTTQPSFPLFIANLVDWLGPRQTTRIAPSCTVGMPCALDARLLGGGFGTAEVNLQRAAAPAAPAGTPPAAIPAAGAPQVAAATPAASAPAASASADKPAADKPPAAERPSALFDLRDGRLVPEHAGLYRLTAGGHAQMLAINAVAGPESDLNPRADVPPQGLAETIVRIAPWLVGAFLLVLLVEGWLAGRGPERFLRSAGLSRRNPRFIARRSMLALRLVAIVFAVAALANLPLFWPTQRQNLVVVAPDGSSAAADILKSSGGDHRAGVVTTGPEPRVVADLGDSVASAGPKSTVTGLEAALRLGAAMLPDNEPGRLLVAAAASPGVGTLADALPGLKAGAVPVDVTAAPATLPTDVALSRVEAPGRLYAGDAFSLAGLIYSDAARPAKIEVFEAGKSINTQPVSLNAGYTWVETTVPEAKRGDTLYEMAVSADGDTVAGNNRNGVEVEAIANAKVLVVSPQPQQGAVIADLLKSQGFESTLIDPTKAPWTIGDWLKYDSIVLMNVPALALDTKQQTMIRDAVSQHGRGLFIMGGENTFGPGGYFETPIESVSPLSSRVPREAPEAALVFVLDRSGSMVQPVGNGKTRIDVAKEATRAAIKLLNKQSQVGIVSFDSEAHIILPLTTSVDEQTVDAALSSFDAGGGTSIYPGLDDAVTMLAGVDAPARHIIIMTDGLTQKGDFPTLLAKARSLNITVSTVAIGRGADVSSVQEIANLGGGSFHSTADFQALPSIMSQEAMLLSGSPVEVGETQPAWTGPKPGFLSELPDALPRIGGFVLTSLKPDASLDIVVPDQKGEIMPLLANWRYGNGQVMALTTQGAGAWTQDWLAMPSYPKVLADILRAFLPSTQAPGFNLAADRRGDEIVVRLDALKPDGTADTGLNLAADVTALAPGGQPPPAVPVRMSEVGAGRYEGRIVADHPDTYEVAVHAGDRTAKTRVYVGYPSALAAGDRTATLAGFSDVTGGRVLQPGDAPFPAVPTRVVTLAGWPLWTVIALMVFMAELFVRYGNPLAGRLRRRARRPGVAISAGAPPASGPRSRVGMDA